MRRIFLGLLVTLFLMSFSTLEKVTYKCMIQMKNYDGEAAYVVLSLLDKNGKYVETLHVSGDDPEWYSELDQWFGFYKQKRPNIDAITGETIAGGQQHVFQVSIPKEKLNSGKYQIRIESSVEEEGYHVNDVVIPLNKIALSRKHNGIGFIDFVRWIKS